MSEPLAVREAPACYVLETQRVRKGYKQTEVGVLPEDWTASPLGKLLDGVPTYGINASAIPYDSRYPTYLRITDISEDGRFLDASKASVDHPLTSDYMLSEGDLVFARTGASVGKSYLYDRRDGELVFAGFLIRARPDTKKLEPRYLKYFVQSKPYWNWVKVNSMRSGQPGINGREYASVLIPLPPTKAEQEAIAGALSDADALIEGLEKLIAKKRHLKQGAMQELLTGKKRLPGFSGEWSTICMREALVQNATYGIVTAGAFVLNGVKMLRGGDIVDGRINTDLPMVTREKAAEYSRTALVRNDVVIALVGYPGATAKIPDELIGANISRAVGLLRLNGKVAPDYLVCFLNSSDGRRMVLAPSAGSAQQVVNLAALNKLEFAIPEPDEQTAIATLLADMDTEIAALEQQLAKARGIKQGMMQELLTGRIRLV